MELGPIFRALLNNKTRFFLITLQVALTLAVVVNCLNMIQDRRRTLLRPTGMDEANILVVEVKPFDPAFEEQSFTEAIYEQDLVALRSAPGVHYATALHQVPLSGGGSATGRRPQGSEQQTTVVPYFVGGTDVLQTLGLELVAGRDFVAGDYVEQDEQVARSGEDGGTAPPTNVILTQVAADTLFPDGDALGQMIADSRGENVERIVGIVRRMHGPWPMSDLAERVILFPGKPASSRRTFYLVRAEAGLAETLYTELDRVLLGVQEGRIVKVSTLAEVKAEFYQDLVGINRLLGGMALLLLAVTSLGVIGVTSFSVTERMRQIGTRRALGATRLAILRYFLVENWIITGVGLGCGTLLAIGLNFLLARLADVPLLSWSLLVAVMAGLWLAGLLAALAPALRGTAVSPVVATRSI